jgi:hypothetical protein
MATLRHEVTGRKSDIGHKGDPLLDSIRPTWTELHRVVDLKEASRLSGLSVDTIKRHHRDKVIDLSPRRRGMRVRDALMLARPP